MRLALALLIACGKPAAPPAPPEPPDHSHHHAMTEPPATPSPRGAYLKISCGGGAQAQFDRGFFFLHNMDYVRARKAFEDGAAANGTCAMLYWGIAMTHFQPLWPGQPTRDALEAGAAAVDKAKAATASPVEREYVAAVAGYYENWQKADSNARLKNWAAAQKKLADKYPDDVEAQSFSALARLATVDRKDKSFAESIAVGKLLEKLLAMRPEHPGLMHYLVHAYDNPALAQNAIDVAHKYGGVSPDAAHALHMPSHIYTRLGNWKDSAEANIKSGEAALKHPTADGRVSRDFLHATDYLVYAYLQMGDDDKAQAAASKIDPATKYELNAGAGAYGLAATPARFALERRAWKEAVALTPRKVDYNWDQYPWAEAITHAARGLGAARLKDIKTATQAIAELDKLVPKIESPWWKERVQIERDVVAAWVARAKKADKQAEQLMKSAADRELAAGKDSVQPGHTISAIEELGDLLLELKRPKEAHDAFVAALKESPRRFNAVYGAARAAELAGMKEQAKTYYTLLLEISAGSKRPARAQAEKAVTR